MTKRPRPIYKNRLALVRRRRLITQKQVATLLNHSSCDQISRYERGVKIPSLKDALKLGLLYGIPVRKLLDDYFDECWREFREREDRMVGYHLQIPSTDLHEETQ